MGLLGALGGTACRPGSGAAPSTDGRIQAVASITPQAYFVERVGGRRVAVEVLVGPGQSPHAYEPTPRQVAALAEADVFFLIGEPFEQQLLRKIAGSFPRLRVVDTRQDVPLRHMTPDEGQPAGGDEHATDAAHAHDHGAPDPHIWLAPRLVVIQARTIAGALEALDPAHAGEYRANLEAFRRELEELDERIAGLLAPLRGRELFVFHPSWGYFCDAYGLRQVAIESRGREPGPAELAAVLERMRRAGARTVFTQPQYPARGAQTVARQLGGGVVVLDPYARDYPGNLLEVAATISRVLTEEQR